MHYYVQLIFQKNSLVKLSYHLQYYTKNANYNSNIIIIIIITDQLTLEIHHLAFQTHHLAMQADLRMSFHHHHHRHQSYNAK